MTISGIFATIMHFIWSSTGVVMALIIIGALIYFLYEQIKGFLKYVKRNYFTKKNKESDKDGEDEDLRDSKER